MNTREKRIWCLLYKHGSSPRSRSLCLCCFCRVCLRRLLSVAILPASAYLCLPACLPVRPSTRLWVGVSLLLCFSSLDRPLVRRYSPPLVPLCHSFHPFWSFPSNS